MVKPSLAALLKKSFISWDFRVAFQQDLLHIGMPIPRRFSFLGDSGNRGLHFFIPRGFGDLEPIPRGPRGIFGELNPQNEPSLVMNMTHKA